MPFIRARGLKALEEFLSEKLHYDLYSEYFANELAEILQESLPEDQPEDAQTLAHEYARNEAEAVDKVTEVLDYSTPDRAEDAARARKAKELVQEYARGEPDAVRLVDELLTGAGVSMDAFMADALAEKLHYIERIDHLAAIARTAATPACARSIGVGRSLAKHCGGACKRSRTASLK